MASLATILANIFAMRNGRSRIGAPSGEAIVYLNGFELDTLLGMQGTRFWHVPGLDRPFDGKAFDRAFFDVRCHAADILRVEERTIASPSRRAS